jgi:glycolate oxidase iron-sulfur subunit
VTASLAAGLEPCVHCGFCLQSCPTYLVTGDESDSPRGRIVLLQGLSAGRIDPRDQALTKHLDRCLGCLACEPVCPSGVSYGPALERARHLLTRTRGIPLSVRLVHTVMAERRLGQLLFPVARAARWAAGLFAGRSRFGLALGMLAATRPTRPDTNGKRSPPATDAGYRGTKPASHAVVLRGCIMDGLFSHVHRATERVLAANGFELVEAPAQVCCGALHTHAGQHDEALALARRNVAAFDALDDDTVIVANAAGCGAMLKEYGRHLAGDPLARRAEALAARVRDVSEVLVERGPRRGASLGLRVAYDPPCHLLHAQGVAREPVAMLDAVDGIERVGHEDADLCCGSAGSYSLAQPALSGAVLTRKIETLLAARPDVVATGNPGCAMQIGAGLLAAGESIPVVHPVEILDWSYERAGFYAG